MDTQTLGTTTLGTTGIAVPPIIFGGNIFGWTLDAAQSQRMLDAIVDAGLTAIDTADLYSAWVPGHQGGESETIIGDWLARRRRRDDVMITTKVGMEMPGKGKGLSRAWIRQSIDTSLGRLKTDYVDLYLAHRDDPDTPLEETLSTFAELLKAGKVKAFGASNYTAARFAEALKTSDRLGLPRYSVMQPHYNLMERADFEAELGPLCLREKIAVTPYWALASGFLTGKYRAQADFAKHARGGGVAKYHTDRGKAVLAALDELAARYKATPGQIAIAWLRAKPVVTAPIASATSTEQLRELVGAAGLKLDAEAVARLDRAST
jgi:aryl-alcohol dehydrogenase-like predicted oxidoreductase